MPAEPDGFYKYNALQQLSYFAVVFLLAPLQILTGLAMSPAIDNHFKWYTRLFGNRQAARSLHFFGLVAFLGFVVVHASKVVITGLVRNSNHIVMGTDTTDPTGLILGLFALAVVAAACVAAHRLSWRRPRLVQYCSHLVVGADAVVPRSGAAPCPIHPGRDLAVLLVQRQDADLRRLARAGRGKLQRLPAAGDRAGRAPGRTVARRPP